MAVLLTTVSCSAWATSDCGFFDRVIDISHERPASIIFNPVDQSPTLGNHYQLIQLKAQGLDSGQSIVDLDAESIAFFNAQLGLNFGAGTFPVALGGGLVGKGLLLPGSQIIAVMVPYMNGQNDDLPIVNDSKGGTNKMLHIESGNLVLFVATVANGSAIIPGGLHAGARVENQDNYFYGNIDLVKKQTDGTIFKVENFKATSDQIGRSPLNEWGVREFNVTLNLTDKNGKVGYGHSMTVTDKYEPDGVTLNPTVRLQNTYKWPSTCASS